MDKFFSILLVVKNEERYLNELIQSLVEQEFDQELIEIIIVDGKSSDSTPLIAKSWSARFPEKIKLFVNEKGVLSAGWNIGILNSQGRYVLRIDGHTIIPKDFLQKNYDAITRYPEAACVGGIIESKGSGFWGKVNQHVFSSRFGVGNSIFRTMKKEWEGFVDTVPYGAYKREVFEQVGFFNEALKRNEDLEMHERIRRAGGRFLLDTSIRSTYYVRNSLQGLIKKSFGDGTWTMVANKLSKGSLKIRHLVPLYAVLMGLLLFGFSFMFSWSRVILIMLVCTYLALLILASFKVYRTEKKLSYLIGAIVAYFALHVSRGLGSLFGLFVALTKRK